MPKRNPFAGGSAPDGQARPEPGNGEKSAPGGGGAQDVAFSGHRLRIAPDPERDLACCRLPLTDMGNAERWRVRHGADFRFCAELGWFSWDGRRWKLLSEEKDQVPAVVTWSIARTVRAIRNEAALVAASGHEPVIGLSEKEARQLEAWTDAHKTASHEQYLIGDEDGERARFVEDLDPMDMLLGRAETSKELWSFKIAAWAKSSEQAAVIGKVVKWIKGFPDIVVRPDQLDADRMAINVLNGTLRLVKGNEKRASAEVEQGKSEWHSVWKIRKDHHRREDLITKLAPVKYAPAARCPAYDAFFLRVQPGEPDRRFIHQWGGLSLTGDTSEQKLAFFYGGGSNGKGTWVELVAYIAGDYAGSIPIESFLENGIKRRGDQATPDIARLPGVRFLRVSEPEKGSSLNEGLIKMVTGEDPVDARHLNKGFFTFLPDFKMTISGNHKPKVKDTSDGIWRRMQLVPWVVNIPREERDLHLKDKLKAEASGVLNRLIEGLLDWRLNGLIEPESVRLATQAYRDQSDDVGRFLSDLCEVGPTCRVGAKALHDLYLAWVEHSGGANYNIKAFKTAMEGKGFEQKQSDGQKWIGVQPCAGVELDEVKAGRWPSKAERAPSGTFGGGVGDDPGGGAGSDWDDLPPADWERE